MERADKKGIPLGAFKLGLQTANNTVSTNTDGGQETVPQIKKNLGVL